MLSSSSHHQPCSSQMPIVVFCFLLSDACAWKNLVFLSPSLSQWAFSLCPQYISSSSRRLLSSPLSLLISKLRSSSLTRMARAFSLFLLSYIFFGICPYTAKFHLERLAAQILRFSAIPSDVLKSTPKPQEASIMFLQSSLLTQ